MYEARSNQNLFGNFFYIFQRLFILLIDISENHSYERSQATQVKSLHKKNQLNFVPPFHSSI